MPLIYIYIWNKHIYDTMEFRASYSWFITCINICNNLYLIWIEQLIVRSPSKNYKYLLYISWWMRTAFFWLSKKCHLRHHIYIYIISSFNETQVPHWRTVKTMSWRAKNSVCSSRAFISGLSHGRGKIS